MGSRANFVIVNDSEWQLYYSHWAGCRMLDALIGGPEFALEYVLSLRRCAKNEWVDPLWADGGAVIDFDRRRLLFFGDGLMVTMNERRAMMNVLAALWPDYAIGWAYDGTMELIGYVQGEFQPYQSTHQPNMQPANDPDQMCAVVSVVDVSGRLRMWPLYWGELNKAWHGPTLIDQLPGPGVREMKLNVIPQSGVHVDLPRKSVGIWETHDAVGIFEALPGLWPGWQVESWEDRYEEQKLRCNGRLNIPALDTAAGVDVAQEWIRKRVFQSFADSPAGHIAEIAGLLSPLTPGMFVNDDARADCAVRPDAGVWARFAAACAGVGGGGAARRLSAS